MTRRIQSIIRKFYRTISRKELERRRFKSSKRLAWFCLKHLEEDFDVTWDEAEEAAALMLDELDDH